VRRTCRNCGLKLSARIEKETKRKDIAHDICSLTGHYLFSFHSSLRQLDGESGLISLKLFLFDPFHKT